MEKKSRFSSFTFEIRIRFRTGLQLYLKKKLCVIGDKASYNNFKRSIFFVKLQSQVSEKQEFTNNISSVLEIIIYKQHLKKHPVLFRQITLNEDINIGAYKCMQELYRKKQSDVLRFQLRIISSIAYHPISNGIIVRFIRTVKTSLACCKKKIITGTKFFAGSH